MKEAEGGSLGAAALRGWAAALSQAASASGIAVTTPRVADPRVLVIAKVQQIGETHFELGKVEPNGVYRKVKKAATHAWQPGKRDYIDRIAVVGEENERMALRAIDHAIVEGKIEPEWIDVSRLEPRLTPEPPRTARSRA
jgi:hypothetical protein